MELAVQWHIHISLADEEDNPVFGFFLWWFWRRSSGET
jgi:hypothetical protein